MANYTVTSPSGKRYRVTRPDSQPTTPVQPQPEPNPQPTFMNRLGEARPSPLGPRMREIPRIAAQAADTALFGLIPNQAYENLPQPEGIRSNVVSGAAQLAALLGGGPGKLAVKAGQAATKAVPKLAGNAFGRTLLRAGEGAVGGALADVPDVENMGNRAAVGAIGNVVVPPVVNAGIKGVKAISGMFKPKIPLTPDDLLKLPEEKIAKLPGEERGAYLAAKRSQESQQMLAQRQAFQRQAEQTTQAIRAQEQQLGKGAPQVAAKSLENLYQPFRNLAKKQSEAYTTAVDDALAQAETVSGQPISFSRQNITEAIANKYLKEENPEHYRTLINKLQGKFTNNDEISARTILDTADDFSKEIGIGAKQKSRAYTPDEVASQHLRDILLEELEKAKIDVSKAKGDWAQWVPVRNLGLKLQTPSGPGTLIRIVRGKDPVRAKNLQQLEGWLGESLDKETRAVFDQLDNLKQQKVLEQAKRSEFQRLQQEQTGFNRDSAIARKLRIDQQARHADRVRQVIRAAVMGAAGAAGIGAVGSAGFLLHKLFGGE